MRYRTLSDGTTSFDVSVLCLGTMHYGNRTDEATARAILDRYVDAGGTFLDTANNYGEWTPDGRAHGSEGVLARWLRDRGARDRVRVATKVGAAKKDPALPLSSTPPTNFEGLSASTVDRAARASLTALGLDHVDVLYGHVDDLDTPLSETVGAFGKLQAEGLVGITGISNVALHRVVEARAEAVRQGVTPYGLVQQQHSYLYPVPQPGRTNVASDELLHYARAATAEGTHPLTVVAYSPLMQGALTRDDKPLWDGFDHPGTHERRARLRDVAQELGATPNQVALAWMTGGPAPVVPVIGPGSVEQLDELLGAADLELDADVRARLDAA
ncbi:aldo/keto reductase [Luteimicrobium subarcticum]|uniref:Aryl-alcohol dehydrogenase-like predicted oxidoreductase n=1 Tax=Luteimicrobium subarcticum TaxID=620910 RepID=A0A2M8W6S3_9MICO|nr:aldo/keto reductase [Luteimicrobium subarcticum]PJI86626.1 aryl-alcohol dehydrogenase-like predicted oxidoreductase [Luteimicrobium subarcticum]